ncbi:hypothetical protein DFH06DRAFT_958692, partial [Mycena polygramma]
YLFVHPVRHLATGEYTPSPGPEHLVFWSFDHSGDDDLSPHEAAQCGLPSIRCRTQIRGEVWTAGAYAGLEKFNQGKEF